MEDQETQNPTQGGNTEGASTLDRLERYLAAQDTPDQPNQEEKPDVGASNDVKPDGDGADEASQPQIELSHLAKYLGVDESALDLDEDGTVKFKTKVDGVEGAAKLPDFIKSYQLQEHVDKKSREASEREKALEKRAQEAEQQFSQRLQYAESLANVAANQLMSEYQSIDWRTLEANDPGRAALLKQNFQERQLQLRGMFQTIQNEKSQSDQKKAEEARANLAKEAEKLPVLIPEWKDPQVAAKEKAELLQWALKAGYEAEELETITSRARNVQLLRKAMLADRLQASKPEIENKVRTAPKLVKPGQAQQENGKTTELKTLKQAVTKSGGKKGTLEAWLLAAGKV